MQSSPISIKIENLRASPGGKNRPGAVNATFKLRVKFPGFDGEGFSFSAMAYRNGYDQPMRVSLGGHCKCTGDIEKLVNDAVFHYPGIAEMVQPPDPTLVKDIKTLEQMGRVEEAHPTVSREVFDRVVALVENEMPSQEIAMELGLTPLTAKILSEQAKAHITVRNMKLKPVARKELAQALANKIAIEGSNSEDPKHRRNALMALKLINDDPYTGIYAPANEDAFEAAAQIGQVDMSDVIDAEVESE